MRGRRILGCTARCAGLQHLPKKPTLSRWHWPSSELGSTASAGSRASNASYSQSRVLRQSRDGWKYSPAEGPSVHPHSSSHESLPLPEQLRGLMRLLTHSVVVCTARTADDHSPRAMTMSSFTSLSLRPTPVVTFNIATPSRTLDALAETKEFNIHVLAGDASGAKVADWFRRGNAQPLHVFDRLDTCDCEVAEPEEASEKVSGAPMLRGPGIMYVLRCKLLDEPLGGVVSVKDHVIVLGEVTEILEGQPTDEHDKERFSLVYADRRYRLLGDVMAPET